MRVPQEPERITALVAHKLGGTLPDTEECWTWPHTKEDGYGIAHVDGQRWRAHRLTYHHLVLPLRKAVVIHHKCANRACVNPAHLQATTHHQNLAEMQARQGLLSTIKILEDEVHSLLEEILYLTSDDQGETQ